MEKNNKSNYQTAPYDALAEQYDDGLSELLGIWGRGNEKFAEYKIQFLEILLHHEVNSIFDFGCGTGRSLAYFNQYFGKKNSFALRIAGCDISKESLKIAKRSDPAANIFLCESVEDLLTHNEKYDLIFLSCVLHHMAPEIRASWINALASMLSDNGRIAIFEHNLKNPYTRHIVNKTENTEDREDFMLTLNEVSQLLAASGMTTEFKGYTLFVPVRRAWITKIETHLTWLPLGAQHCTIGQKISQ